MPDLTAAGYDHVEGEVVPIHAEIITKLAETLRRLKPRRVLDAGCGSGKVAFELRKMFPEMEFTGFDPSESGIQLAQKVHACAGVRFAQASIYDEPPVEWLEAFDFAYSAEVVEHLYAPRALPAFLMKVVRPGGGCLVTTPYHGWLKNVMISVLGKWDSHVNPLWDHGHIKFWSPRTLRTVFENGGWSFKAFTGLGRAPWLWMSMALEFER